MSDHAPGCPAVKRTVFVASLVIAAVTIILLTSSCASLQPDPHWTQAPLYVGMTRAELEAAWGPQAVLRSYTNGAGTYVTVASFYPLAPYTEASLLNGRVFIFTSRN